MGSPASDRFGSVWSAVCQLHQSLACAPLGQERDEVVDAGGLDEVARGLTEDLVDGLGRDDAAEFLAEPGIRGIDPTRVHLAAPLRPSGSGEPSVPAAAKLTGEVGGGQWGALVHPFFTGADDGPERCAFKAVDVPLWSPPCL